MRSGEPTLRLPLGRCGAARAAGGTGGPSGRAKALACYGLLFPAAYRAAGEEREFWLRFVDGRPVSAITTHFLAWCCERLPARGVRVWVLVWDNASWHISRKAEHWLREHNRTVKRSGNVVRILPCPLPAKSPWLNPIDVHWYHGERQTVEAERVLTKGEMTSRIGACCGRTKEPHLDLPGKVA